MEQAQGGGKEQAAVCMGGGKADGLELREGMRLLLTPGKDG